MSLITKYWQKVLDSFMGEIYSGVSGENVSNQWDKGAFNDDALDQTKKWEDVQVYGDLSMVFPHFLEKNKCLKKSLQLVLQKYIQTLLLWLHYAFIINTCFWFSRQILTLFLRLLHWYYYDLFFIRWLDDASMKRDSAVLCYLRELSTLKIFWAWSLCRTGDPDWW